ncbi:hypothetical protein BISA_1122 [Bifidobacterium saguini DSM 23967]|uniref:Uncharacterized protein n=2 Tax=Bifidobacterium saguini TaxID=762210 RepID=A0A087D8I4_9BIFI|nr:hypothetical protein [Bifidobacterium saguini]KFI91834.1 hypothetical protein BISA_1122 [Bifidobacterium saguini DSM 23967]QTB90155.1 hypothetical protein BSD967_07280 [Bifidobacterium saguini]
MARAVSRRLSFNNRTSTTDGIPPVYYYRPRLKYNPRAVIAYQVSIEIFAPGLNSSTLSRPLRNTAIHFAESVVEQQLPAVQKTMRARYPLRSGSIAVEIRDGSVIITDFGQILQAGKDFIDFMGSVDGAYNLVNGFVNHVRAIEERERKATHAPHHSSGDFQVRADFRNLIGAGQVRIDITAQPVRRSGPKHKAHRRIDL